jgi:hypothetical protein
MPDLTATLEQLLVAVERLVQATQLLPLRYRRLHREADRVRRLLRQLINEAKEGEHE